MIDEDNYVITNNLRHYRKSLRITQEELARELGKSKSFISKIESGGYEPSLKLSYMIVEALNKIYKDRTGYVIDLSIDKLFGLEMNT